jgi:hypothetical protein
LLPSPYRITREQVPDDEPAALFTVASDHQVSSGRPEEEELGNRLDVGGFERSDKGIGRGRPERKERPLSENDQGTIRGEGGSGDGFQTVTE